MSWGRNARCAYIIYLKHKENELYSGWNVNVSAFSLPTYIKYWRFRDDQLKVKKKSINNNNDQLPRKYRSDCTENINLNKTTAKAKGMAIVVSYKELIRAKYKVIDIIISINH